MKFRTKLYLSLILVSFISVLIALSIDFFESRKALLQQIGSKGLSIAAAASVVVDPELIKQIHVAKDMQGSAYKQTAELMRKMIHVNQRKDVYVGYMYIVRPTSVPNLLEVVIDAEPEDPDPTGKLVTNKVYDNILQHLNEYYSPLHFSYDPYGRWLSSYVPVYDSNKQYVGTLGVDFAAKEILGELNILLLYGLLSLVISILFSCVFASFLAKYSSRSLHILSEGVGKIGQGDFDYKIQMKSKDEFREVADAINTMGNGLKERERLKVSFSRYVSNYVLEKILKSEMPLKLEGEKKKITVLFSDIFDFTSLAEKMPPEKVVALLNEYFEYMLDIIFKNSGTLDKFLGDGLMAEFGSPLSDPEQEKHAVSCALQMQEALQKVSDRWKQEGKPQLSIGIGIHTGEAIVGNIGTLTHMEYTAIGDTVNVASRIERATREVNVPILVSEVTWERIKDEFEGENLGEVQLKGRLEKITIYSITGKKKK